MKVSKEEKSELIKAFLSSLKDDAFKSNGIDYLLELFVLPGVTAEALESVRYWTVHKGEVNVIELNLTEDSFEELFNLNSLGVRKETDVYKKVSSKFIETVAALQAPAI